MKRQGLLVVLLVALAGLGSCQPVHLGRRVAARSPAADVPPLLAEVDRALDLLDAGDAEAARAVVRNLTVRFAGDRAAALFQVFLRRRFPALAEPERPHRVATDPAEARRVFEAAEALLARDRRLEALALLEEAHALDSGDREISAALVAALKEVGLAAYAEGRLSEALGYWRRALEISPGDPETQGFISRAEKVEKQL